MPHFQSESWCTAFDVKMSFHSHADKTIFRMKGCAPGLALKKRHKTTRKWPSCEKEPLANRRNKLKDRHDKTELKQ